MREVIGPNPETRETRQSALASLLAALLAGLLAVAAVACGSGAGGTTIVFMAQGLGTEGAATRAAIDGFTRANPNLRVEVRSPSPTSDKAYGELAQLFVSGSDTPDVVALDVTWAAAFAQLGWIRSLDDFHPATSEFFPAQVAAGTYEGKLYAIPWFINAEGVYYRTDLVAGPPATPQELLDDAAAAMAKDPSVTSSFAFEGARYEGLVTAFADVVAGFGGRLDLAHVDAPAEVSALTFMRDAIARSHVSPPEVTSWQEGDVQQAFLEGRAAFAINWPYVFALAEAPGSGLRGRVGWIPFPSAAGTPSAALGGSVLAINARSRHPDLAWKFVRYLTQPQTQVDRALLAGDPPAVRAAYGQRLYDRAPYYEQELPVFRVATSRPVTPLYVKVSQALQTQLNAVLVGETGPGAALATAQAEIDSILSASG